MPSYLIYALCDPRFEETDTRHVFYIGKSTQGLSRAKRHGKIESLQNDDLWNKSKALRIRELQSIRGGLGYSIKILAEFLGPNSRKTTLEERLPFGEMLGRIEMEMIKSARSSGVKLLNRTEGGENVVGPMTGRKPSPELRLKWSRIQKIVQNTPEARARSSEAKRGSKNPMFGKPGPNKGKIRTKEHCRNLSISLKGKRHFPSEETRRKLKAAAAKRLRDSSGRMIKAS